MGGRGREREEGGKERGERKRNRLFERQFFVIANHSTIVPKPP